MGACLCTPSLGERVPVPLPRTVVGWSRLGVRPLLRVHGWLRTRAISETVRTERGARRIVLEFSVPSASAAGRGADDDGPCVVEHGSTLRAVAAALGNASNDGAPVTRNWLRNDDFRRAAAWLVVNRAVIAAKCDARFFHPLAPADIATLEPELSQGEVRELLLIFRRLNASASGLLDEDELATLVAREKPSLPDSVFFGLLAACAAGADDAGADARISNFTGGLGGLTLDAASWVTAVDAFCSLSPEGLARLAFYGLAVVGTVSAAALAHEEDETERDAAARACGDGSDGGERSDGTNCVARAYPPAIPPAPAIAVSSLTRFFPAFADADVDPSHPSRVLLDELRLRRAAISRRVGSEADAAARYRERLFAGLVRCAQEGGLPVPMDEFVRKGARRQGNYGSARGSSQSTLSSARSASGVVLRSSDTAGDDDWGDDVDAARRSARAVSSVPVPSWRAELSARSPRDISKVSTGSTDLLSFDDFAGAFRRSPASFFDLIYFQRQLRKAIFGKAFWAERARAVAEVHSRLLAPASASGGGRSWIPSYHGYNVSRAAPQINAAELDVVPAKVHVPSLRVPPALAWALRIGDRRWAPPPAPPPLPAVTLEASPVPSDTAAVTRPESPVDVAYDSGDEKTSDDDDGDGVDGGDPDSLAASDAAIRAVKRNLASPPWSSLMMEDDDEDSVPFRLYRRGGDDGSKARAAGAAITDAGSSSGIRNNVTSGLRLFPRPTQASAGTAPAAAPAPRAGLALQAGLGSTGRLYERPVNVREAPPPGQPSATAVMPTLAVTSDGSMRLYERPSSMRGLSISK